MEKISLEHWSLFSSLLDRVPSVSQLNADVRAVREVAFRESLEKYLQILIEKNEVINLTAIDNFNEGIWKHLYDSLLLLEFEPLGSLVDWGTGGGTPGIPLALFRKRMLAAEPNVLFLDSIAKKLRCVEEFAGVLGLKGARFFMGRGEELLRKEKINAIVMRAVAPPSKAISWVSQASNHWIFMTGPSGMQEWRSYEDKMKKKGFSKLNILERDVPFNQGKRFLLKFSK